MPVRLRIVLFWNYNSVMATVRTLTRHEWQAARDAYLTRVGSWAKDRVWRSARQIKHPVYDFLFEYYSNKPGYLMRWTPGVGVQLVGMAREELDWGSDYVPSDSGFELDAKTFPQHRYDYLDWAIRYLESTANREPFYGCFGLHEWAMVYQESDVRHRRVPLRLTATQTNDVVTDGVLRCSHYDAFRFFTPAAVPQNRVQLRREISTDHDQPACVHVNMDLYKFAYKIAPFVSSEAVADAFELAIAARELDMRASPYDLREFGFAPVAIETREGREEYVTHQREIARRGVAVRAKVLGEYQRLREAVQSKSTMQI